MLNRNYIHEARRSVGGLAFRICRPWQGAGLAPSHQKFSLRPWITDRLCKVSTCIVFRRQTSARRSDCTVLVEGQPVRHCSSACTCTQPHNHSFPLLWCCLPSSDIHTSVQVKVKWNAVPSPPIYCSKRFPNSDCYNARERHTPIVRARTWM